MAAEYCFSSVEAFPGTEDKNRKKRERMRLRFKEILMTPTSLPI